MHELMKKYEKRVIAYDLDHFNVLRVLHLTHAEQKKE